MTSRSFFRLLGRANTILIFLAGLGVCGLMIAFAWRALGIGERFTRIAPDTALLGAERSDPRRTEHWSYGAFDLIPGSEYLVAPVRVVQPLSLEVYSAKENTSTRNYLFLHSSGTAWHWLLPAHGQLILASDRYAADGSLSGDYEQRRPVKWFVFEAVVSDSNNDRRLTAADRKSLLVANADGTRVLEVLKGMDAILGKHGQPGGRILVVYSAGGSLKSAQVDLEARAVTGGANLPLPGAVQ